MTVDFYENDCLPLRSLFRPRNILIIFRRWRELMDCFFYIYILKIKKGSISDLYKFTN